MVVVMYDSSIIKADRAFFLGWCRVVQGGAGWSEVEWGGVGWSEAVNSLEYRVLIG